MRAILCPADHTAGFDARLETALALARATNGHVSLPIVSPMIEVAAWEPFGGVALTAGTLREMRAEDEALARTLETRLARAEVPFAVAVLDEDRFAFLCAAARFADLIVLGRDDVMLEEIVLAERCPVLALPPQATGAAADLIAPAAMIAWDGSRAAAHALKAALPLLARAGRVDVVTIDGKVDSKRSAGADPCDANLALRYLSRHAIHAELQVVRASGSIARTLRDTAAGLKASLVVMGLYGHSRVRELVIGGVTREMIAKAETALLLSH